MVSDDIGEFGRGVRGRIDIDTIRNQRGRGGEVKRGRECVRAAKAKPALTRFREDTALAPGQTLIEVWIMPEKVRRAGFDGAIDGVDQEIALG